MKNLTWILHGISLLAILFLFIQNQNLKKNTSSNSDNTTNDTDTSAASGNSVNYPIAFFNSDSLLGNLGFFKEGEKGFKKKQESMMNELRNKEMSMQREIEKLQNNAQNMTRNELETAQQKLGKMEQDLMMRKEKLSSQFAQETAEFNEKLHQKVTAYLKDINAEKKYKYVFSFSRDGNIFYADDALDITQQMIKDLNEKYTIK
ncbi:MAG: OmpH family outer membrane protein [Bacteroidota bacterium]|nr:OmpH family outer membrane protein [Bacteroidota bacterium]